MSCLSATAIKYPRSLATRDGPKLVSPEGGWKNHKDGHSADQDVACLDGHGSESKKKKKDLSPGLFQNLSRAN